MKAFSGYRRLCLLMALGATLNTAHGAATILLWPIDPWLAADTKATELWVQNQGNSATTMQVRHHHAGTHRALATGERP